ncbi:MAG: hypothetical protein SFZ02_07255 [bacterium]|nr:hypothetical protein [bacterium]
MLAGKQSQANKNYWAAYAIWKVKVAEAQARIIKLALLIATTLLVLLSSGSTLTSKLENADYLKLITPEASCGVLYPGNTIDAMRCIEGALGATRAYAFKNHLDRVMEEFGTLECWFIGINCPKPNLGTIPSSPPQIQNLPMPSPLENDYFRDLWDYFQRVLPRINFADPDEPDNTILVSHYTTESSATKILADKIIDPSFSVREQHVYVFEGRSNTERAQEAGAVFVEARIVFYARPSELVLDPEQSKRLSLQRSNTDPLSIFNVTVIGEARMFILPGPVDLSWRQPCIERPTGFFGTWSRCP